MSNSDKQPLVGNWSHKHGRYWPIPLRAEHIGGFLGERIRRNNQHSIRAGFFSPIVEPFSRLNRGEPLRPEHLRFVQDSDAFKLLEGACYALASGEDGLVPFIDSSLDEVLKQELPQGGFCLPPRIPFDPKVNHELYAAGHFIEMACAHYLATGRERALLAACRWADMLLREHKKGNAYFETVGIREHPEIEIALVRLYRITNEQRYLDLAAWVASQSLLRPPVSSIIAGGGSTHAVRVGYLMSGYAELYLETGEERFLEPLRPIWNELVGTRLYLTGGLGMNECIPTQPYHLPQTGAIAETCASIAAMMFAFRAQSMWDDASLYDTVETILYNHFLGALNPEQDAVFYYNPLRQIDSTDAERNAGKSPYQRVRLPDLHGCSCCFPNVWRFLAQLPEYILSTDGNLVNLNLFTSLEAELVLAEGITHLSVTTDYPLGSDVNVMVSRQTKMRLRVPAWCNTAELMQGERVIATHGPGWLQVTLEPHVPVTLRLPMQPEVILADGRISANLGQAAFRYGPLIYCYESASDADECKVRNARLQHLNQPKVVSHNGIPMLEVKLADASHPDAPYFAAETLHLKPFTALLGPFYLHANRGYDTHWTTWLPLA